MTLGRRSVDWLRPYWRRVALMVMALSVEIGYWTLAPLALRVLIDDAVSGHDAPLVIRTLMIMAAGFVAMAVASTARSWLSARLGSDLVTDTRIRLFDRLQRFPPDFFAATSTGDISGRFLTDLNSVENGLAFGLPEIAWGALQTVVNIPLLFALNLPLAVVACLVIPLAMVGPRVLAPRVATAGYLRRQSEGRLLATLQEQISGRAVIRAFGLERLMRDRVGGELTYLGAAMSRDIFQARLVSRATTFGSAFGQLLVFATGSVLVFRGDLSVGTFVGFIGLLLNVGEGVRWLGFGLPPFLQAAGPMQRLDELLAEPIQAPDADDAVEPASLKGQLDLREVSFAYPGDDEPRVRDLDLSITPGSKVAIVGPSGSGKSTLLNLLMRAYDPTSGVVTLDGYDLRRLRRDSVRRLMSVVFQESFLFAGSVRDNIRLGRPDASDADVERAARAAQLHDALQQLPNGYETQVGERGGGLSGGQRQRVALARALLREPAILLLDEPTSALDPVTEAEFIATLSDAGRGRSVVSVTHRLRTVVDSDQIFVMEHGRLVQTGTHSDLLRETNGVYFRLWTSQSGFSLSDDGLRAEVSAARLRLVPLFANLPEAQLSRLALQFVAQRVPASRTIVLEGDIGDRFYLIARGTVEISQTDASGVEHVLNVLEDGDYFGELALLERGPRTASARARTDTVLLSLAAQNFERMLAEESSVREAIERVAAERSVVSIRTR